MPSSSLPRTSCESAQLYLDERFDRTEWHQGGPVNAYAVEGNGRWIADFSRNARPQDVQQANAARAILCKESLAGVPSALLECLQPGDLLVALRYLGLPLIEQDGGLGYVDGDGFEPLGADEAAVRRVRALVNVLPVPEDVLGDRIEHERVAA